MNDIIPAAELAARRTAAAAVLADYQRAAPSADVADRAMWAARLADMLAYLVNPAAQENDPGGQRFTVPLDVVGDAMPPADTQEAGKLAEIRALLAAFDWEFHDRQLALEAIERIVEAGQ